MNAENDSLQIEKVEETINDSPQIEIVGETANQNEHQDILKAHKIGDMSLTVTTVILVIISIYFDAHFAPFIILLMSSRIGKSVYTIIKTTSKKEIGKLVVWLALFAKSAASCFQLLV